MSIAQRLALVTSIATFILIGVGVYVRATGSGLGCPDWPTCHGDVVPISARDDHDKAIIEMVHRYFATMVGMLVIATAVAAWKWYRHVPFITRVATVAVPLVGFQGLLGALTVTMKLPPEIVASHLLTAMFVLTAEVAVFVAMYTNDPAHAGATARLLRPERRALGKKALFAIAWLAVTMWIGGYMTERGASTACTSWPACNGSALLPGSDDHEIVHMAHRYLAAALLFLLIPVIREAWRQRENLAWSGYVAQAMLVLYIVQVVVGALNVWYTFPDPLTVSHTVIASGVWVSLATTVILSFYSPSVETTPRPVTRVGVPA
ncbi:MAG: COX15/CtaA family protein [Thermoflexaceae bacterium]|nr:COX15/CtaA family protein [Thermoflexaceae bacterium]